MLPRAHSLLVFTLALTAVIPAFGGKSVIKVGSYNLFASVARKRVIAKNTDVSPQRYWCHSARSVARMLDEQDCDIISLQEVCDSISGARGEFGVKGWLPAGKYSWILYPGSSTSIVYDCAIVYKPSRLTCLQSGVFWTGGYPLEPRSDLGRGAAMPCVWALMKDRKSGKRFYFLSVHLNSNPQKLQFNAQQFVDFAHRTLVPPGIPSIVAGDFNCDRGHYTDVFLDCLMASRWQDAWQTLREEGALPKEERQAGTMNAKNDSGLSRWRPDHILYDGFIPLDFHTDRRQLPTTDGSLHYPSDHLPVTCIVRFK